jgi:DNA-directed RNA polymerase subunit M/transcription elongation factor TFIIS
MPKDAIKNAVEKSIVQKAPPKKKAVKKSIPQKQEVPKIVTRESNITVRKTTEGVPACPRCGEVEALITRYQTSGGKKLITCLSESCRKIRPRGRGFVILQNGRTFPSKK